MKIVGLKVKPREEVGTRKVKHLRAQGKIPAVFYGEGAKSFPLIVDTHDFKNLISAEARTNIVVKLEIEGKRGQTAIIKEIQKHPLEDFYLHVDFLKIALDEEIETTVPVTVLGESAGVKEGGVLQHGLWEIKVKALPKDLPDHFEVDISRLEIGDTLRVSDVVKPDGVQIITEGEETLVSVVPPTELKEELVEEEVVEPEVVGEEEKVEKEKVQKEKEEPKSKESGEKSPK